MNRRKNALVRVCIWTFVAVLMIAMLVMGLGGQSFALDLSGLFSTTYAYDNASEYKAGGATLPGNIREISIHWVGGEISVEGYDGDTIIVEETAGQQLDEEQQLHYRVKGNKLTIQYCASRRGIGNGIKVPNKSLVVRVPVGMGLMELSVENVSSTVRVDGAGLALSQLDIETVSGAVTVRDVTAREMKAESVSGQLDIAGIYDVIDTENVSGRTRLALSQPPREVDIETVSGSVDIFLAEETGVYAALETVSGSLNSNFAEINKKRATYGDESARFEIETVSGSVRLDVDADEVPALKGTKPLATAYETPVPAEKGEPVPSSGRGF